MQRKLVSEAKPNALPQAERTKSHAWLPLLRRIAHTFGPFCYAAESSPPHTVIHFQNLLFRRNANLSIFEYAIDGRGEQFELQRLTEKFFDAEIDDALFVFFVFKRGDDDDGRLSV